MVADLDIPHVARPFVLLGQALRVSGKVSSSALHRAPISSRAASAGFCRFRARVPWRGLSCMSVSLPEVWPGLQAAEDVVPVLGVGGSQSRDPVIGFHQVTGGPVPLSVGIVGAQDPLRVPCADPVRQPAGCAVCRQEHGGDVILRSDQPCREGVNSALGQDQAVRLDLVWREPEAAGVLA